MSKQYTQGSDAHGHEANVPYINFLGGNDGNGRIDKRRFWILAMIRRAANENKPANQAYSASLRPVEKKKVDATLRIGRQSNLLGQQSNLSDYGDESLSTNIKFATGNVHFSKVPIEFTVEFRMRDQFIQAFCDLCLTLDNKTVENTYGALDFIRITVPGLRTTNPGEYNFAVALVQVFVKDIFNSNGAPLLNEPGRWIEAKEGVYYSAHDILNNLFPRPSIKVKTGDTLERSSIKGSSSINRTKYYAIKGGGPTDNAYLTFYYEALNQFITELRKRMIGVFNALKSHPDETNVSDLLTELHQIIANFFQILRREINEATQGESIQQSTIDHTTAVLQHINEQIKHLLITVQDFTYNKDSPLPAILEELQKIIISNIDLIDQYIKENKSSDSAVELGTSKIGELYKIYQEIDNCINGGNPTYITSFTVQDVQRFLKKQTEYLEQQVRNQIKNLVNPQPQQTQQSVSNPMAHISSKMGVKSTDRNLYTRDPHNLDTVLITRPGQQPVNAAEPVDKTSYCKSGLMKDYADRGACDNFFESCITGSDIAGCKQFLMNTVFFETELDKFLEGVNLYKTMLAFFKFQIPLDSTDKSYIKFKKTDDWIRHLHTLPAQQNNITQSDVLAIQGNRELLKIIDHVIDLINKTPILLNRDWKEATPASAEVEANELTGLAPQYVSVNGGVAPKRAMMNQVITRVSSTTETTQREIAKALEVLEKQLNPSLLRLGVRPGMRPLLYVREKYTHSGGGQELPKDLDMNEAMKKLESINIDSIPYGSPTLSLLSKISEITMNQPEELETLLKDLTDQLKTNGYSLATDDSYALNQAGKDLRDNRKTILYVLLYGYYKLLFFDTELKDIILSTGLSTGDTGMDTHLRELYKTVEIDIAKIKEMIEIAKKKLIKYCKKVENKTAICKQLVTDVFKNDFPSN